MITDDAEINNKGLIPFLLTDKLFSKLRLK
jgi:hypothetical protein